jgi:hypothetical protein
MLRVCKDFAFLVERMEPFLKGTPLETSIVAFTAIADVVEVRLVAVTETFLD